jgi:hypothetical protein
MDYGFVLEDTRKVTVTRTLAPFRDSGITDDHFAARHKIRDDDDGGQQAIKQFDSSYYTLEIDYCQHELSISIALRGLFNFQTERIRSGHREQ